MLTLLRHLDRLHVSEAEIEGIPVHIASFTNITVQFPTMEYVIRIHVTVRLIRLWVLVSMSEQYNASSTSRKFSTSNTCRVFNSILARGLIVHSLYAKPAQLSYSAREPRGS